MCGRRRWKSGFALRRSDLNVGRKFFADGCYVICRLKALKDKIAEQKKHLDTLDASVYVNPSMMQDQNFGAVKLFFFGRILTWFIYRSEQMNNGGKEGK